MKLEPRVFNRESRTDLKKHLNSTETSGESVRGRKIFFSPLFSFLIFPIFFLLCSRFVCFLTQLQNSWDHFSRENDVCARRFGSWGFSNEVHVSTQIGKMSFYSDRSVFCFHFITFESNISSFKIANMILLTFFKLNDICVYLYWTDFM